MHIDLENIERTADALRRIRAGRGRVEGRFWYARAPASKGGERFLLVTLARKDPNGLRILRMARTLGKRLKARPPSMRGTVTWTDGHLMFEAHKRLPHFERGKVLLARAYKIPFLKTAELRTKESPTDDESEDVETESALWVREMVERVPEWKDVDLSESEIEEISFRTSDLSDRLAHLSLRERLWGSDESKAARETLARLEAFMTAEDDLEALATLEAMQGSVRADRTPDEPTGSDDPTEASDLRPMAALLAEQCDIAPSLSPERLLKTRPAEVEKVYHAFRGSLSVTSDVLARLHGKWDQLVNLLNQVGWDGFLLSTKLKLGEIDPDEPPPSRFQALMSRFFGSPSRGTGTRKILLIESHLLRALANERAEIVRKVPSDLPLLPVRVIWEVDEALYQKLDLAENALVAQKIQDAASACYHELLDEAATALAPYGYARSAGETGTPELVRFADRLPKLLASFERDVVAAVESRAEEILTDREARSKYLSKVTTDIGLGALRVTVSAVSTVLTSPTYAGFFIGLWFTLRSTARLVRDAVGVAREVESQFLVTRDVIATLRSEGELHFSHASQASAIGLRFLTGIDWGVGFDAAEREVGHLVGKVLGEEGGLDGLAVQVTALLDGLEDIRRQLQSLKDPSYLPWQTQLEKNSPHQRELEAALDGLLRSIVARQQHLEAIRAWAKEQSRRIAALRDAHATAITGWHRAETALAIGEVVASWGVYLAETEFLDGVRETISDIDDFFRNLSSYYEAALAALSALAQLPSRFNLGSLQDALAMDWGDVELGNLGDLPDMDDVGDLPVLGDLREPDLHALPNPDDIRDPGVRPDRLNPPRSDIHTDVGRDGHSAQDALSGPGRGRFTPPGDHGE